MHKKWLLLMLVITLVITLSIVGCSGGDSPAAEEVAAIEPAAEEPVEEPAAAEEPAATKEPAATEEPAEVPTEEPAAAEEALFDFYNTPSNWPRAVPAIMMEFLVTEYERTENTMHASGTGDVSILRANNYYMNAKKKEGSTSFKWEFDPTKASVTEGSEQVFYYLDEEGKSLAINLKEIGPNKIEFSLDYAE